MLTNGSVLEIIPARRMRLAWSDDDWPAATEVEISLTEVDRGTVVRVLHVGWEHLPGGQQLAGEHAAGWRMHLSDLRDHLRHTGQSR